MDYLFRKAMPGEVPKIWEILQQAITRRKNDGSKQWQDGYPNLEVINSDIEKGVGYVLVHNNEILGYCAVLVNDEPAYADIKGKWLTEGDFLVYHRVAISENHLGKGLAVEMLMGIERFAMHNSIESLRADTNFDNAAMLRIFEKLGYTYCGEVFFRGSARKAFEKIIGKN